MLYCQTISSMLMEWRKLVIINRTISENGKWMILLREHANYNNDWLRFYARRQKCKRLRFICYLLSKQTRRSLPTTHAHKVQPKWTLEKKWKIWFVDYWLTDLYRGQCVSSPVLKYFLSFSVDSIWTTVSKKSSETKIKTLHYLSFFLLLVFHLLTWRISDVKSTCHLQDTCTSINRCYINTDNSSSTWLFLLTFIHNWN